MKKTTSSDSTSTVSIKAVWDGAWEQVSETLHPPPPAGYKSAAQLMEYWGLSRSRTCARIRACLKDGLLKQDDFYVRDVQGRYCKTPCYRPVGKSKRPAVSGGALEDFAAEDGPDLL